MAVGDGGISICEVLILGTNRMYNYVRVIWEH